MKWACIHAGIRTAMIDYLISMTFFVSRQPYVINVSTVLFLLLLIPFTHIERIRFKNKIIRAKNSKSPFYILYA